MSTAFKMLDDLLLKMQNASSPENKSVNLKKLILILSQEPIDQIDIDLFSIKLNRLVETMRSENRNHPKPTQDVWLLAFKLNRLVETMRSENRNHPKPTQDVWLLALTKIVNGLYEGRLSNAEILSQVLESQPIALLEALMQNSGNAASSTSARRSRVVQGFGNQFRN